MQKSTQLNVVLLSGMLTPIATKVLGYTPTAEELGAIISGSVAIIHGIEWLFLTYFPPPSGVKSGNLGNSGNSGNLDPGIVSHQ